MRCFFYFLRCPSGIWLARISFRLRCMLLVVIVSYLFLLPSILLNIMSRCPTPPPLHYHGYTHTHLPPPIHQLPRATSGASGELLCPVVPLAFRAPPSPTHHFSVLANPSSLSPTGSTVVHRHSLPFLFFFKVDLSVVTPLRLIFTPRRPYIPLNFLLDMVIVFICVHL